MSWLLTTVPWEWLHWLYGRLSGNTTVHKLLERPNAHGPPIESQSRHRRHDSERHATRGKSDVSSDQNSKVSVLNHPEGELDICGGEFNGVAGNQFRVQVNVNGCHSQGSQKRTAVPMACDEADLDTEGNQDVKNEGSQALSSDCMCDSLPIPEDSDIRASRVVQQVSEEPYTIYFRCLATRERGSPLWIPEPNKQLSVEYQRNGLVIGDIGIITNQGCFDSLFNISLPLHHPLAINTDDLPRNFSPLEIRPSHILKFSKFKKGASLSSGCVSVTIDDSSGLTFESSASEGAILTLPDGSSSEDLRNQKILRDYLAAHLEEIYRCAMIKHGREINNGDLRIVTGFDKTATWGMAAFSNSTSQRKPSFRLEFRPRDQGCVGQTHSWKSSGLAEVKAGPDTREVIALRMGEPSQQDVEYRNQAVFLRTQNPTLNPTIWNALLKESGAGEPQCDDNSDTPSDSSSSPSGINGQSPGSGNSTNETGHQSAIYGSRSYSFGSPNTLAIHPSNEINAMLLKLNPSAQMAITGDDIWISVLKGDDNILPSFETLWSRILKSYDVRLEDGVVFLKKLEAEKSPMEPVADALELPNLGCESNTILNEESWQRKSRKQSVKMISEVRDGNPSGIYETVPLAYITHSNIRVLDSIARISQQLAAPPGINFNPRTFYNSRPSMGMTEPPQDIPKGPIKSNVWGAGKEALIKNVKGPHIPNQPRASAGHYPSGHAQRLPSSPYPPAPSSNIQIPRNYHLYHLPLIRQDPGSYSSHAQGSVYPPGLNSSLHPPQGEPVGRYSILGPPPARGYPSPVHGYPPPARSSSPLPAGGYSSAHGYSSPPAHGCSSPARGSSPVHGYSPPMRGSSPPLAAHGYSSPAQGYSPPLRGSSPLVHGYSPPAHGYSSPPARGYSSPARGSSPPAHGYSPPLVRRYPLQVFAPPMNGNPTPSYGYYTSDINGFVSPPKRR